MDSETESDDNGVELDSKLKAIQSQGLQKPNQDRSNSDVKILPKLEEPSEPLSHENSEDFLPKRSKRKLKHRVGSDANKPKKKRKKSVILPPDKREELRNLFTTGEKNIEQLAKEYVVTTRCVRRIIAEGKLEYSQRKPAGVPSKFTPEISHLLAKAVLNDPSISGKALAALLEKEKGFRMSFGSINRHLRSAKLDEHCVPLFSIKQTTQREVRNDQNIKEQRVLFVRSLQEYEIKGSSIIYIDEISFSKHTLKTCEPETENPLIRTRVTFETITAIAAISHSCDILHCSFVGGSLPNETFCSIIRNLSYLLSKKSNSPCVFVIENDRKTDELEECISEHGHQLIANVPNSHLLNPIEYVFDPWKDRQYIPGNVRTVKEFTAYLSQSMRKLCETEAQNSIKKVWGLLFPRVLNLEDML